MYLLVLFYGDITVFLPSIIIIIEPVLVVSLLSLSLLSIEVVV